MAGEGKEDDCRAANEEVCYISFKLRRSARRVVQLLLSNCSTPLAYAPLHSLTTRFQHKFQLHDRSKVSIGDLPRKVI